MSDDTRTVSLLPNERKSRRFMSQARRSRAQSKARTALVKLRRDDYERLYQQELERIMRDEGPITGDPCSHCEPPATVGIPQYHDKGCQYDGS